MGVLGLGGRQGTCTLLSGSSLDKLRWTPETSQQNRPREPQGLGTPRLSWTIHWCPHVQAAGCTLTKSTQCINNAWIQRGAVERKGNGEWLEK